MQQASVLMQLLQAMDNLVVVAIMTIIVIGVRVLWVGSQKKRSASPAQTASKPRGAEAAAPLKRQKDTVLEIIDTVLIALILVFGIVRPFLLQTFFIPSGSMEPTLMVHDRLIANKFIFKFRQPERGEVIVFQPPIEAVIGNGGNPPLLQREWMEEQPEQVNRTLGLTDAERKQKLATLPRLPTRWDDYIKRVIGLPGDRIRIEAGKGVFINGKLLEEKYLPGGVSDSAMTFPEPPVYRDPGPPPSMTQYMHQRMGAQEVAVAGEEYDFALNTWLVDWYRYTHLYQAKIQPHVVNGEFIVPPNSVFMMGDNRTSTGSFDSRYWGVVPLADVKARAVSTFWPLNRLKII